MTCYLDLQLTRQKITKMLFILCGADIFGKRKIRKSLEEFRQRLSTLLIYIYIYFVESRGRNSYAAIGIVRRVVKADASNGIMEHLIKVKLSIKFNVKRPRKWVCVIGIRGVISLLVGDRTRITACRCRIQIVQIGTGAIVTKATQCKLVAYARDLLVIIRKASYHLFKATCLFHLFNFLVQLFILLFKLATIDAHRACDDLLLEARKERVHITVHRKSDLRLHITIAAVRAGFFDPLSKLCQFSKIFPNDNLLIHNFGRGLFGRRFCLCFRGSAAKQGIKIVTCCSGFLLCRCLCLRLRRGFTCSCLCLGLRRGFACRFLGFGFHCSFALHRRSSLLSRTCTEYGIKCIVRGSRFI